MRNKWQRVVVWLALIALLSLVIVPSANAQSKTLRWHRWDADIQINADGTVRVSETFEIEFVGGEFSFGFRGIDYSQFERLENISVREGSVQYTESRSEDPQTYYWTQSGDEYVINWFYPPSRDQTRTFTVEYTIVGVVIIGGDDQPDRFFWKAVGAEHAWPIQSSTVVVRLPDGAVIDQSKSSPAAFGPDGAAYEIGQNNRSVTFSARDIPANQEFEVGVPFTHGVIPVEEPAWQSEYEREQSWNDTWRPVLNLLLGVGSAFLLIVGLLAVYFVWRVKGKDPEIGAVPEYLTEPPSDLPPGVVGTLVDEKADMQDIVATLVDLARRGAIDMQENEKKVFGITASKNFTFKKRDDFNEELRGYEKLLIKEVFGSKNEVALEDLEHEFYTAISKLEKELYKETVKEDLFPASPQSIRGRWLGLGIAGLVIAGGAGFCSAAALVDRVDAILCPFVSLGVTSLALAVVSRVMPAKSRKGAGEAEKWKAFKQYLQNAERYEQLSEHKDKFDRYLPYAIAFGLERTWVNKFVRVEGTPIPRWYYPAGMPYHPARRYGRMAGGMEGEGGRQRDLQAEQARPAPSLDSMSEGAFSGLSDMTDGLFSMLNTTSSVLGSVPSSSGSGSYSGGGFSSGGFSSGGGSGGGSAGFG